MALQQAQPSFPFCWACPLQSYFNFLCIRLSAFCFNPKSQPSAFFLIFVIVFSFLIIRNFKASSLYCCLLCHNQKLPTKEARHTTAVITTQMKTLDDLMSKLCLWICSCGCGRSVNQQVQNYKTYLKNSHFGVEKLFLIIIKDCWEHFGNIHKIRKS